MAATPWITSNDLVIDVQRHISFPLAQNTFQPEDILAFANHQMANNVVPNLLQYHEEYFVTSSALTLETNRSRYPLPNRAIGLKLRDVFYADNNTSVALPYGNLYEMTRINPDDKAWFQTSGVSNNQPYKFYLEGNDIVVIPAITGAVSGLLVFYWFMRPNQLVPNERAMILSGFSKNITITNSSVVAGDTVTLSQFNNASSSTQYVFTAVSGAPGAFEFQIGATSTITSTNLTTAINTQNIGFIASNGGSSPINIVKITYTNRQNSLSTSNSLGFSIQATLNLESASTVPANITAGSLVDLLQTLPGHKTLNYDILVPIGGVSGSTLTLTDSDVPPAMLVGDYACSANECIIPQIPPELHGGLVHKTCTQVLIAIGDKDGLAVQKAEVAENDSLESALVDNRVDGSPLKILNRNGILRNLSRIRRGRFY